MQHSAVPELAHTHTRPIHWVATATAVAGVVALSSLLPPDSATAAQEPGRPTPPAVAPPAVEGVDFPLECGPVKAVVEKQASGDLDGDGRPETVAVVHCDAGISTPPDGVYVLTHSDDGTEPRVVATLVDPKDRFTVSDFAVREGAVLATLLGYSSSDVPTCCPDVEEGAKWQWRNGAFVRSSPAGARSV
ncbi:hypothetical protein [Streptomyces chromofuscus]|uniref:Secreted protein n=1 Tax=Streptomyces chromofuscus TaxID=42881 RepID=A0A7M2TDD1_STRCW|nr:hypothetical protein [Streptomyces chromofuscus]QOV45728.1 hypothetical protein IPT68_07315 [Streptomyces chromofuscus]GGT17403.1 hypothetical protein GCM10010254_42410 [Streptomyces chromofuscus]